MVFNEMDDNIKESIIHYVYLVLFIGMLTGIIQYKNKNNIKNDIIYILGGIGLFVLSLYLLRILNSFNLYNSIVHGLGITIAVLLLLSFINHNNSDIIDKIENEDTEKEDTKKEDTEIKNKSILHRISKVDFSEVGLFFKKILHILGLRKLSNSDLNKMKESGLKKLIEDENDIKKINFKEDLQNYSKLKQKLKDENIKYKFDFSKTDFDDNIKLYYFNQFTQRTLGVFVSILIVIFAIVYKIKN